MESPLPAVGVDRRTVSPQHPIDRCLDHLKDEVFNVLSQEASYKEAIQKLEKELNVYKRAFSDLDVELKDARTLQKETEIRNKRLENECLSFKKQDKGHRVVILLDGDGAIFNALYIGQGRKGGHTAAQVLSDSTLQCLTENYGPRAYQLWVYVFFNKRGLMDTFRRVGMAPLINNFEDFAMGFNQATERFLMVDVGNTKEAADAKLKVYLEDEIRLSETYKIFFGGCHDNGYIANLHSQITAGYKEKLILLKSYTEMAAGIAGLGLPSLEIPDLFMPRKIGEDTAFSPTGINVPKDLPFMFGSPSITNVNLGSMNTPLPPTPRPQVPNLPITKQKPPPCTLFYLKSSCKFGSTCKYAHDYLLTDAQTEDMRKFAKKAPCPVAVKGEECMWGQGCCYGHICPYLPNCFFQKQGKCKFRQANMHASPKKS